MKVRVNYIDPSTLRGYKGHHTTAVVSGVDRIDDNSEILLLRSDTGKKKLWRKRFYNGFIITVENDDEDFPFCHEEIDLGG